MKAQATIDEAAASRALAEWLPSHLGDVSDLRIEKVKIPTLSGFSATTVLFDAIWQQDGDEQRRGFVARVAPLERDHGLFRDYDLQREGALMRAFGEAGIVPAPRVVAVEDDTSILGGPFLLTEFQPGRIPQDNPSYVAEGWVFDLSPDEQARVFDEGLKTIAAIHTADHTKLDVPGLAEQLAHPDPLGVVIDRWVKAHEWGRGDDRPNAMYDATLEWLLANKPTGEDTHLNWGDARLGNLIFGDDLSVKAVLDWEMWVVGSPEMDLGWFLYHLRWTLESTGAPQLPGFPTREQAIARYEELTGRPVRNALYYEVLAAFVMVVLATRYAVILTRAGMLPPDNDYARNNPSPAVAAKLLGVDIATGA
jgi:aminoglycoside phosphotransferase (APT) family kinase protein